MKLLIISLLVLLPTKCLAAECGMASWYGSENKRSCTGKPLHHKTPAVAHKTLPMGTKVRITALRTNKSVVAIVEDRGPYKKGRIVDMNRAAAKQLGIIESGITQVILERIK